MTFCNQNILIIHSKHYPKDRQPLIKSHYFILVNTIIFEWKKNLKKLDKVYTMEYPDRKVNLVDALARSKYKIHNI